MAPLYWLEAALAGLLPALWMSFGVGLPWALAALPPRQWRARALVSAMALALGPAWVTAWMLVLGIAGAELGQALLTREWILLGSGIIALAGAAFAWRKRKRFPAHRLEQRPLRGDEKLILALIAIAIATRWLNTAFWPFTAYDALWVFGYQGRLFFLEGNIPATLDYYPPFLSLQFAYVQIVLGEINDQAARMVLPLLHIGGVLAAYLLGKWLAGRRAGLYTAALWSLHHHVGQWASIGDLEITLNFSFTLAAAFFLRAWLADEDSAARRHDARLAGLLLGIALFTKPTTGAFILGVLLLLTLELALKRMSLPRWRPRLELAGWLGLACLPLGGVWYLRNLLLGHEVVTFPKEVWLTRALRSGDILAPMLLAVFLTVIAVALARQLSNRRLSICALGLILLMAGALASNARLFPTRVDPPASYIQPAEAVAILLGLALLGSCLLPLLRAADASLMRRLRAGLWALLLALPYYVTFFYSYSYHYRLGFAIQSLLCLPSAIALAYIFQPTRVSRWPAGWRWLYYAAIVLSAAAGITATATHVAGKPVERIYPTLDNDIKKYQVFNPSLMEMVFGLQEYQRETGQAPVVAAPGEERLPFFFPRMEMEAAPLTTLEQLEALGASHVIYGAKAQEAYQHAGMNPQTTQLVAALGRSDLFQPKKAHYDATISYTLYEVLALSSRFALPPHLHEDLAEQPDAVFGERIQLWTPPVHPPQVFAETPLTFAPTWRPLQPLERDYEIELRLLNDDTGVLEQSWRLQPIPHQYGNYAARHWEPGEYVYDLQVLHVDGQIDYDKGYAYVFQVGIYDPGAGAYLPLTIDGKSAGHFYQLPGVHDIRT